MVLVMFLGLKWLDAGGCIMTGQAATSCYSAQIAALGLNFRGKAFEARTGIKISALLQWLRAIHSRTTEK